ncbi:Fc.00g017000.m01.CDS01 [Cosmosporella sp. VM-42]
MHASAILAAAALWATAKAVPAPAPTEAAELIEKRADQTALWVSVNDEGQPLETYTPSMTVVDGTTSVDHAAPHDLTASVYTFTEWGEITTSTGEPPNPTATGKSGIGAFSRCVNMDGEHAPFCAPAANSTLYVGNTYYVTWDPDYFNTTHDNTTMEVAVRLDWLNQTSDELQKLKDFPRVPAKWGFWPFPIQSSYLKGTDHNITLTLLSNEKHSAAKNTSASIWLNLAKAPLPKSKDPKVPEGRTLTIALPTVFGAIIVLLIGGCLWNRKTRKIDIGNIMSRSRHGYSGRSTRRMFRGRKDNGIQLDTHSVSPPAEYRDEFTDAPPRPRRDSDALGSLAGSPIDPHFQQQGTTGGRNAFRDEMRRQELERK